MIWGAIGAVAAVGSAIIGGVSANSQANSAAAQANLSADYTTKQNQLRYDRGRENYAQSEAVRLYETGVVREEEARAEAELDTRHRLSRLALGAETGDAAAELALRERAAAREARGRHDAILLRTRAAVDDLRAQEEDAALSRDQRAADAMVAAYWSGGGGDGGRAGAVAADADYRRAMDRLARRRDVTLGAAEVESMAVIAEHGEHADLLAIHGAALRQGAGRQLMALEAEREMALAELGAGVDHALEQIAIDRRTQEIDLEYLKEGLALDTGFAKADARNTISSARDRAFGATIGSVFQAGSAIGGYFQSRSRLGGPTG